MTTALDEEATAPPVPASRSKARRRRVLIGLAVLWALALTAVVLFRGPGNGRATPAAVQPTSSPSAAAALSVAQIYQRVLPSVVLIEAVGTNHAAGADLGTGVVANANGTIITALHVVDGARSISVTFADGTHSTARVAAASPGQDIATLTPATLPSVVVPATLGGSAAIGDEVVAIGNPLGLTDTTTSGVVSAVNRTVAREKQPALKGLIQFDAAVNPGSSGGPLLNTKGAVVGIVVALANPTSAGTFIGIGFAVPIGSAVGAGNGPAPRL